MPVLSNLIVRIGASTDDFDKKVNASLNKIKRFGADVAQAGQALSIGISAPLALAGAAALKAASDMETLSKGLSATMKSTSAAADELQRLKEVAKLPGLGLEEAVKGSI
jgi:CRISPR/Cas system type I-B associated protein Csh2 (Cas7 group RAMP superfamily)